MFHSKFDGFLDVLRRSGVDANDWYAPLLTWNAKRSVEVTSLDRPIRKGVSLPVGVFSSAGLVRTPDTVEPPSLDVRAVS